MKSVKCKVLCVVLALAMVLVSVPFTASAASSKITFGIVSDVHYLADDLYDYNSKAWQEYLAGNEREMEQANSIISNAFEIIDTYLNEAKEKGSTYVLIPGDLTKDGEYLSHVRLSEKLRAFEEETGIQVFVINGNHDIRNSNATDYTGDKAVSARYTEPWEFAEIYKEFGYDESEEGFLSRFRPEEGNYGGYLSYSRILDDRYMLLAIDSGMYSTDNGTEEDEHVTDGRVGDDLLVWIQEQCEYAHENGYEIITMQHHNIVPHIDIEEATLFAFVVEDWQRICDVYADSGIHYIFTGHLHAQDNASYVNDNGERITDVLTSTLTGYPNNVVMVEFTSDGNSLTMDMETHDVDEIRPVSYVRNGETITYEQPYKYTASYFNTYGDTVEDLACTLINGLVLKYFPAISEAGGLVSFLSEMGIDLQTIITDAINTDGLAIGDMDVLTVSGNVMSFINELGNQIDEKYINDPEYTMEFVQRILHKLLSLKVSDIEPTLYEERTGITCEGGTTLDVYAQYALLSYYGGDEDFYNEPVFEDVLNRFEDGTLTKEVFELIRETLVEDIVENEILAGLEFNPGELFPEGTLLHVLGVILQNITEDLLDGDNSFLNLVNSVLGISLVPDSYSSIDNILDTLLLGEYLTDSQYKAWGETISWMVKTFVYDDNPDVKKDNKITLTYSGKEDVEATKENYRLPSHVVMTLGDDASTMANFSWVTKYSVKGSDIDIVPYSADPDYENDLVEFASEELSYETQLGYPGADLGVIGLLQYETEFTRHNVTVMGLEPGTKYSYRIGDREKDWWCEGTFTTADGSDKTTFINVADSNVENDTQGKAFNEVLTAAFKEAPDAAFIVSNGNNVDNCNNRKQWQSFFDMNADILSGTFFMSAAGDKEKKDYALDKNFKLPNLSAEQDTETGAYYSYDYNNIHFTVLNANDTEDDKLGDEQLDWMKEDIKNSDAKWKIVVLGKAAYSNGANCKDDDFEGIRSQLCALMPYLGVDMVLEGGDHVYLRTDALNANFPTTYSTETVTYEGNEYEVKVNPNGTVYSVPGTAGLRIYEDNQVDTSKLFPEAECTYEMESSMFSAITVDGDYLYYNAYTVNDGETEKVDSFALEKSEGKTSASEGKAKGFLEWLLSKINFTLLWKILATVFPFITDIIK